MSTISTMIQRFHLKRFHKKKSKDMESSKETKLKRHYKISEPVEKPPKDNVPSNLAIMGR